MGRKFVTIDRSERKYVPKDWLDNKTKEPEEKALTFKFIPLSKRQLAQFADNSTRMSLNGNVLLLGTASINIEIFKTAICGWDNFIVNEKPYKYKKGTNGLVDEEVIDILDQDIIDEVALHILDVSKATDEAMGK